MAFSNAWYGNKGMKAKDLPQKQPYVPRQLRPAKPKDEPRKDSIFGQTKGCDK